MKRTCRNILALSLAGLCSASALAFEVPEFKAGPVAIPGETKAEPQPVPAADNIVRQLSIKFDKRDKAEEIMAKLADYLGPRLTNKELADRDFGGVEMKLSYTGAPLSAWIAVYKAEDAPAGLYYVGPRLDDQKVKEYEDRGIAARQEIEAYLQSERTAFFFPKAKTTVIHSYTVIGRVNGRDDRGKPIEILSPFSYLFLDGGLSEGVVSRLNKSRYWPIFHDK